MRRRIAELGPALLAVLLVGACSSHQAAAPSPRPVTTAEAERLAIMRFNNYDRGSAAFTMSVRVQADQITLSGRADFREHVAYATFRNADTAGLMQWTLDQAAINPSGDVTLPASPPAVGWQVKSLDPAASTLDTALLILLNLASDRPENALLIRQNGATWQGNATIDGKTFDTFRVTSGQADSAGVTYVLDAEGTLRRVIASLGGGSPMRIDLGEPTAEPIAEPIAPIPQLRSE